VATEGPPRLVGLAVGGTVAAWIEAGFAVAGRRLALGTVTLEIDETTDRGVHAWRLTGTEDGSIDGLLTVAAERGAPGPPATHPNGSVAIDHVVVRTPDLGRTVGALVAFGIDPRRTRDAGRVHQTFFRLGEVVLEVVGPPEPAGSAPATFWGLAVTVEDLDATVRRMGERVGPPKDAVQPGRRIATLREDVVALGVPLAFLSARPHP